MRRLYLFAFLTAVLCVATPAQTSETSPSASASTTSGTKRKTFRANKEQIAEAQTKLKTAGKYSGEADGKMNADFRTAVKAYQGDNGLRRSGALNRATLEKMKIALTDEQKEIPIPASSYLRTSASSKESGSGEKPKRGPVFRATKDQINEAQAKLKAGGMYDGEMTGKLSDETRAGLKKYQEANGLKVTGTLNRATLEKMGIELTERQKSMPVATEPAS